MTDRKIGDPQVPRYAVSGDANRHVANGEATKHRVGPLGGVFVLFRAVAAFVAAGGKGGAGAASFVGVAAFTAVAGRRAFGAATFDGIGAFAAAGVKSPEYRITEDGHRRVLEDEGYRVL